MKKKIKHNPQKKIEDPRRRRAWKWRSL